MPEAHGEIHVKAGHLHDAPTYAVKVASGFYAEDPAAIDGLVLVFDARTGAPVALLLDAGLLTDVRTGAAGGVAARWLAPQQVDSVAIVGTGIQARRQLEALRCVRPDLGDVRLWGRDMDRAMRAAHDIGAMVSDSVEEAVTGASVVITATSSHEPLVDAAWVAPGARTSPRSAPTASASRSWTRRCCVAPTSWPSTRSSSAGSSASCSTPSIRRSARSRSGGSAPVTEAGRTSPEQLTICDLTGVGVQDVAAANAVLAGARPEAGESIEL